MTVYPVYHLCRFLWWVVLRCWCGYRVEGRRHIPRHGAFIVAANHRSFLDPPAVGVAFRQHLHFIAKDELFRIPYLGALIRQLGAIPVMLSKPLAVNTAVLKTAMRLLAAGRRIAIFPEGRRNFSGSVEPAKLGVAMLAVRAGVPILPVAVIGTDQALPADATRLHRSRVTVRIGAPITLDPSLAGTGRDAYLFVSQKVTASIAALIAAD